MMNIFFENIVELFLDFSRGVAIIVLISPVFIYDFIHGDPDRYRWLISGPEPFNKFGGGPYQLFMYIVLIIIGIILFVMTSIIKKKVKSRNVYE